METKVKSFGIYYLKLHKVEVQDPGLCSYFFTSYLHNPFITSIFFSYIVLSKLQLISKAMINCLTYHGPLLKTFKL